MAAHFRIVLIAIVLGFAFHAGMILNVYAAESEETVTVEAEGSGETKIAALKDAWTNAVRKAVGMYMASKTEMLNDELTEEIAAYSRGKVNSFETLSEKQENGVWTIAIKANVDRDAIQETVAASTSKKLTLASDSNLVAQTQSEADTKKDAKEYSKAIQSQVSALLDFTNCLNYEPSLFKTKDWNGKELIFMKHVLKVNLAKFEKQSEELEKLISQIAVSKREVRLPDPDACKRALKVISQKDYPININWSDRSGIYRGQPGQMKGFYIFYPNDRVFYHKDEFGRGVIMKRFISFPGVNQDNKISIIPPNMDNILKGDTYNICFFKNTSTISCYELDKEIEKKNLTPNRYKLEFITEKGGTGYDDIVSISDTLYFEFQTDFSRAHKQIGELFAPSFYVSYEGPIMYHNALVFIYLQALDIPVEERLESMDLIGKYELEPIKR